MKKFFATVWRYAFPLRQIYGWYLEFTHVRITNGVTYYQRSSTKLKKNLAGFGVLGGIYIVGMAFYVKLGGDPFMIKLSAKKLLHVRNSLNAPILGTFVSFLAALQGL